MVPPVPTMHCTSSISSVAPQSARRQVQMQYCGVCHAHLHIMHNDGWGNTVYPLVPGHEIIGRVVAADSHVTCHKVDDIVSFCCIVEACQRCDACNAGLEKRCDNGFVSAYNGEEMPTCGMARAAIPTASWCMRNWGCR